MKKRLVTLLSIFVVILFFQNSLAFYSKFSKYTSVITNIYELIKNEYVTEISDTKLVEAAISGMLKSLDAHSAYLNKDEFEEMKNIAKGEFGGLGIEVILDNGLKIISPIDDTPAFFAGIKSGDVIIAVDDESITTLSSNEAISKIRGKKGSKVKLTIQRPGEIKPLEFTLTRDLIKIQTVKSYRFQNIGYLRISSFGGKTAQHLRSAILALNKNPQALNGYIIDLRNNPGGLLDQAINVCELFLEEGIIVKTKNRKQNDNIVFKAHPGTIVGNTPIIVLINEGSASASEILAGALQDHKRAVIMGNKSYGKASVQTIFPVNDYGAISLTTGEYFTPSGKSIHQEGIIPDIIVNTNEQVKANSEIEKNLHLQDEEARWQYIFNHDIVIRKAIDLLNNIDQGNINDN